MPTGVRTTAMCPYCGSGKVEEGIVDAECKNCGWVGKPTQLIRAPLSTTPGSDLVLDVSHPDQALALLQQVSEQFMELVYKDVSKPLGLCILRAGLVGRKDKKNMARLIRAGCLAAHRAVLGECEEIAKDSKVEREKNAS